MKDRRVLKLFITNWTAGALMGAGLATALLWSDAGGIASLLARSDAYWAGAALLFGGFAITFGGVVCASAVMLSAGARNQDTSGGHPYPSGALMQESAARALRPGR